MLGVNALGADGQAIGQKSAGWAGRFQTEVGDFIPAVQLPIEALSEDPLMEELDISGAPAAPISIPYMGNKRKPMSWFFHGYHG